jgi:hypothetical protein
MTLPAALTDRAGTWTGTNGFRLMPSDPLYDAPATGEVSIAAGGNLVAIAYSWTHPDDGAQDGLLVVGADDEPGTATAFWGDSWHQSPTPKACVGTMDGDLITVGLDYGGGWRWQITVDPTSPGVLRLRMDNVIPDEVATDDKPAGPYPVMVMDLRPT